MTDSERKLLEYVKTVSAAQLLTDLSGENLIGTDVRGIGKLRIYRLSDEVKNVLLYYAKCNMGKQIDYKSVYRIAARWSRMRVQTAEEAFELIKKEEGLSQHN